MYVRRLELAHFRCYRQLDLVLPAGPVILFGANAQGKTTLLEAAFMLATTRAPYGVADRLLVHWGAGDEVIPYSKVRGEIERAAGTTTIDIVNVQSAAARGDERYTKRLRVDDAPRRAMDVIGTLNVVLFTPRDIDLIHGAPSERRRYLDVLLCQIDPAYVRALGLYNHVVVQRNHLLRRLRDRGGDRRELAVWDEALVAHGGIILSRRIEAVRQLAVLAQPVHNDLVGDDAALSIVYSSRAAGHADRTDDAATAERFARLIAARREEEIARGMSLHGPHRDDLELLVGGIDIRTFGSRGQQRTVTLALKLAEAELMWRTTGERPVLLLDDVLSELDRNRRQRLLQHVAAHEQSWITTTDLDAIDPSMLDRSHVIEVAAATLTPRSADGSSAS